MFVQDKILEQEKEALMIEKITQNKNHCHFYYLLQYKKD